MDNNVFASLRSPFLCITWSKEDNGFCAYGAGKVGDSRVRSYDDLAFLDQCCTFQKGGVTCKIQEALIFYFFLDIFRQMNCVFPAQEQDVVILR